jgi:hypothetical protein
VAGAAEQHVMVQGENPLRKILLGGVLFSLSVLGVAAPLEAPSGWRFPTEKDVHSDWKDFGAPNHFEADFNADGLEDHAWILLGKTPTEWAVFVFLAQTDAKPRILKLVENRGELPAQRFAISLAPPSKQKWKSACGKGYWECKPGEPAEFQITLPSIQACHIESACTIYMWSKKTNSFQEIRFSN